MKFKIIPILLFVFISNVNAQTNCVELLAKEITWDNNNNEQSIQKIVANFSKLTDCGLDEEDISLFGSSSILGALLFTKIKESSSSVTYQMLFNEVVKIKSSPDYYIYKEFEKKWKEMLQKKPNIKSWSTDRKVILMFYNDKEIIKEIDKLLRKNTIQYDSYATMINELEKQKKQVQVPVVEEEINNVNFYTDVEIVDYEEVINKGLATNKPLLLYFTSYADVNSRKMEDAFFYTKGEIQDLLTSKYEVLTFFVDSKKDVPKEKQKTNATTGKLMSVYGYFYQQIQLEQFNSNSQPFFVIIDSKGKSIKTQSFTLNKKEFLIFLKE